MKRWLAPVLAAALLAGISVAEKTNESNGVFPYPTRIETLDNGLQVILIPMNSEGLVSYWSVVRTGSRDEVEPGHTGFAHFFEHMMFRGTDKFPQDVYGQIITEMGADANAFTSDDLTAYHMSITADDLERAMEIESDRFQNLKYSPEVFKTEAGAVYGEYRKNRSSPFFTAYEAMRAAAFDEHTYGHTTMGYVEDIQAMPQMYDYSLGFFKRFYRPENITLLIAGDIDTAATLELVGKYYGGWKPGYVAPEIPVEPEQQGERRIDVAYEGRSLPILWTAYKFAAFDPGNPTVVAADLLAELAFGETSDIYKKLVLEEQVVEMLAAGGNVNRDPGLFDLLARVKDPAKVDYVLAELDRTIEQYQQTPADAARLAGLKSRMKYEFLMDLDTPDNVAGNLARLISATGGVEAANAYYAAVDAVTVEDVQAAAAQFLVPERRTIAVLRGTE